MNVHAVGMLLDIDFAISSATDEKRGVAMARHLNSSVRVVVRTRYVLAIDELMRLGATEAVVEEFEASLSSSLGFWSFTKSRRT